MTTFRRTQTWIVTAGGLLLSLGLCGCPDRNQGPFEEAGERVDEALEDAGEHTKEAVDEVKAEIHEATAPDDAHEAAEVEEERRERAVDDHVE